jgi:hypothetical protein
MAYDFRANQIRTEKLIVSSALGQHRILIYPVDVATDLQGTVGFNTSAIGTDILFFVSGAKGGRGGATANVGLFGGDLVVSGNLILLSGLSGSLQRLSSGIPYLLAGPNINVVTNSLGQIEISSSAGASDPSPWKESNGINIQTTSSVAITGNPLFFAPDVGSDVYFYVSGSSTKKAVFGGDVVLSGSFLVGNNNSINKINGQLSGSIRNTVDGLAFLTGSGATININYNTVGQYEISCSTPLFYSQSLIKRIELSGYQTTSSSISTRIGGTYFRVQDYTNPGFISSSIFESVGFVTAGTGSISLYNITDSIIVSSLNFSETSDTYKSQAFVLNSTASVILEVRCNYVSGSSFDYAGFMGTKICINYS